jgi:hypothetical protein
MDDPIVEQAELIVEQAHRRWAVERDQRRLIRSGLLLVVSGVLTALGGILTAPAPQSGVYLVIGILDGVALRAVAHGYLANRQLLKRAGNLRR